MINASDPRICRKCGERVLDMKYHLEHAHPRPPAGADRGARIDPAGAESLREASSLLSSAHEFVFAEPLRAMHQIARARDLVAWTLDRTKPRPPGPAPAASSERTGKRRVMDAAPRGKKPRQGGDT